MGNQPALRRSLLLTFAFCDISSSESHHGWMAEREIKPAAIRRPLCQAFADLIETDSLVLRRFRAEATQPEFELGRLLQLVLDRAFRRRLEMVKEKQSRHNRLLLVLSLLATERIHRSLAFRYAF